MQPRAVLRAALLVWLLVGPRRATGRLRSGECALWGGGRFPVRLRRCTRCTHCTPAAADGPQDHPASSAALRVAPAPRMAQSSRSLPSPRAGNRRRFSAGPGTLEVQSGLQEFGGRRLGGTAAICKQQEPSSSPGNPTQSGLTNSVVLPTEVFCPRGGRAVGILNRPCVANLANSSWSRLGGGWLDPALE